MRTNLPLISVLGIGAAAGALATGKLDFASLAAVATIVALLGMLASIVLSDGWTSDEAPVKLCVARDPASVDDVAA